MAAIRRIPLDGWEQFTRDLRPELFGEDQFRPGRYLFRGVSNHEYELVSSFDRMFPAAETRTHYSAAMLNAFREECRGEIPEEILRDDQNVLAIGQHHGLPTRLLDWSESPYIAAFFALTGALPRSTDPQAYAAVWALHLDAPIWQRDMGVEIVEVPTIMNMRLRNQAGRFTHARTTHRTLEAYVDSAEWEGVALTQMFFPASTARRGLAELAMMGLKTSQLFPDLDGAAAAARTRVLLDDPAEMALPV
jgi:hypothetical protein